LKRQTNEMRAQHTMEMSDLRLGQMFTYEEWPRFFRRPQSGIAHVVGIEEKHEIVHICLLVECCNKLAPYIMHLPITFPALLKSKLDNIKQCEPISGIEDTIGLWRKAWHNNDAGVFSMSLREIRKAVEETVEPFELYEDGIYTYVATAYPKKAHDGKFRIIHAETEASEAIPGFDVQQ